MRIGIVTYHSSHNYGSMLQAYALTYYLKSKDYDVEIVDFRSKKQLRLYRYPLSPFVYNFRHFKKYLYSFTNPKWLYHECKKWSLYEKFIIDNLPVTSKRYTRWVDALGDLKMLQFDLLIAGGDQIWNMQALHFDKAYYLSGVPSSMRKISYSPSFGGVFLNKIKPEEQTFIKQALSNFSYISVRETSMKEFLQPLIETNISITVDPTLLLCAEDYNNIFQEEPIIKESYIFYYSPFPNINAERLAILYGKLKKLKVITTFPRIRKNEMSFVQESGPSEFLNLLKNATIVIGKSFHLVVFSLLFHKDFIVSDGIKDNRIRDILERVGLEDRGSIDCSNYDKMELTPIDTDKIDAYISLQRQISIDFLKQSINH